MRTSDALWELFKVTGRIGAYLLYRQCSAEGREIEDVFEAGQGKA